MKIVLQKHYHLRDLFDTFIKRDDCEFQLLDGFHREGSNYVVTLGYDLKDRKKISENNFTKTIEPLREKCIVEIDIHSKTVRKLYHV